MSLIPYAGRELRGASAVVPERQARFEARCVKLFKSGLDTSAIAERLRAKGMWRTTTEARVYNALYHARERGLLS